MSRTKGVACRMGRPAVAVALTVSLVVALAPNSMANPSPLVAVGTAAKNVSGAVKLGALSGSTQMQIDVVLKPRDLEALSSFATDVSTPGSPLFRRYLSPGQFGSEFGATPSVIDVVESALRSDGLRPAPVSADHLSIPLTATAAQFARAFSTSFERYRLPGGRIAFANTAAPMLPALVATQVEAVIGLDNLARPQPLAATRPARLPARPIRLSALGESVGPQPCAGAVDSGGYTANDFASVYDMSALYGRGDEGAGQTIAILEYDEPNLPSDIATYQACYGTHTSVSYIPVDGGSGSGPGEGEAALDIETVIGLAPQARILVYQGHSSGAAWYDTLRSIINQDVGKVVSISYGLCEALLGSSFLSAENSLLQEAAAQGQSVLAASGDDGSETCYRNDPSDTALSVSDPGSQPFVTSVGGTDLYGSGTVNGQVSPAESPWNDAWYFGSGNGGAGGGGISNAWFMPGYQSLYGSADGTINGQSSGSPCANSGGYCREVPDVAADGSDVDGYAVFYDNQWGIVGGTSAATPLWAAVLALANASCPAEAPVGFANPSLYWAASPGFAATAMWDIGTQSSTYPPDNDFLNPGSGYYSSLPAYDMATGLGSPDAVNLAGGMCGYKFFRQLPGTANDISVGADGVAWVIGTNVSGGVAGNGGPSNYGIYRWNGSGWTVVPGAGYNIAVDPAGNPWIVNASHVIYHWNGHAWLRYPGAAESIAVGADGVIWVIGTNQSGGNFGIYRWNGSGWSVVPGAADNIAVDPAGNPWIVNSSGVIYHWNGAGWTRYPGAAEAEPLGHSIAVGADGVVWVMGTNHIVGYPAGNGYQIYRWTGSGWSAAPGAADAIAVGRAGNPWIINDAHSIYYSPYQ